VRIQISHLKPLRRRFCLLCGAPSFFFNGRPLTIPLCCFLFRFMPPTRSFIPPSRLLFVCSQMVVAILGMYTTIYTLYKVTSGGKKEAPAAGAAAASAPGSAFDASGYKSGVEPSGGSDGVLSMSDDGFEVMIACKMS